jgi:hypothetical protein
MSPFGVSWLGTLAFGPAEAYAYAFLYALRREVVRNDVVRENNQTYRLLSIRPSA